MGKKRYYCDYCDKSFVDNPTMIKNHKKGFQHQANRKAYFDQHMGPSTGRTNPSLSKSCHRFFQTGECPFGMSCRYSHSPVEMQPAVCFPQPHVSNSKWCDQFSEEKITQAIQKFQAIISQRKSSNKEMSIDLKSSVSASVKIVPNRQRHLPPSLSLATLPPSIATCSQLIFTNSNNAMS